MNIHRVRLAGLCVNFAIFLDDFNQNWNLANFTECSRCNIIFKSVLRFLTCYMQTRHILKLLRSFFRLQFANAPELARCLINIRVSVGAAFSQRVVYSRKYKEAVCHCGPCFRLVMICSVNNSTRCVCFGQPVSAVILVYGNLKLVLVSSDTLVTHAALCISILSDTLKYR